MPSDSIAGFLDRAQASRVLFPEQVEQLIRQPDLPHTGLASLCAYLLSRGVLTKYQAEALRDGRANELSLAGYPVLDVIGPCRGGTAYQALHPSLRTPLVIRKLHANVFAPGDDANSLVNRARTLGTIQHPNLLPLLDAGISQGQPYAVLEQPTDIADLATMLKEVGGAMPGFLAAEYGWAIASALRAIHERGGWHGEVQPGLLFVGPIITKTHSNGSIRRRPAPNATVKLAETGLVAMTPPAAVQMPPAELLPYLPPERIDGSTYDARGDIYGLGASLYLLLAGRPPFMADSPTDVLKKVRFAEPSSLAAMRPDLPAELVSLVTKMMAKRPEDRPQTAFDVCQGLAKFARPGTLPAMPPVVEGIPEAVPASGSGSQQLPVVQLPQPVPVSAQTPHPVTLVVPDSPPEPDGWGVDPNAFSEAQAASVADATQRRRRPLTEQDKRRSRIWLAVGLCLHLTAVAMCLGVVGAYWMGWFDSTPTPATQPEHHPPKEKDPPKKTREGKA